MFLFCKTKCSERLSQKVKLCVYNSAVLSIITVAALPFNICRTKIRKQEKFQKRALKWLTNSYESNRLFLIKNKYTAPNYVHTALQPSDFVELF